MAYKSYMELAMYFSEQIPVMTPFLKVLYHPQILQHIVKSIHEELNQYTHQVTYKLDEVSWKDFLPWLQDYAKQDHSEIKTVEEGHRDVIRFLEPYFIDHQIRSRYKFENFLRDQIPEEYRHLANFRQYAYRPMPRGFNEATPGNRLRAQDQNDQDFFDYKMQEAAIRGQYAKTHELMDNFEGNPFLV